MWYHHVYAMPFIYYHNGYSGYVGGGGRVRSLGAGAYEPHIGSGARTTVVRGGFGGIGGARGFSGSWHAGHRQHAPARLAAPRPDAGGGQAQRPDARSVPGSLLS